LTTGIILTIISRNPTSQSIISEGPPNLQAHPAQQDDLKQSFLLVGILDANLERGEGDLARATA
jgi:hypothetical protein